MFASIFRYSSFVPSAKVIKYELSIRSIPHLTKETMLFYFSEKHWQKTITSAFDFLQKDLPDYYHCPLEFLLIRKSAPCSLSNCYIHVDITANLLH